MKSTTVVSLFGASALVSFSTGAFAQAGSPAPQAGEEVGEAAGAGEIIVTARKRSENIRDVPVSIVAVEGATLRQQGVSDLVGFTRLTPGVQFSRAPDDGIQLTIRGIGTPARNNSFENSVGVFIDDVFLGKGRLYLGALMDVGSVEVVKGTQSTLLGKNTSAGALIVKSRLPGDEFAADFSGGVEVKHGGWDISGGVDLPVSPGARFRIAGLVNHKIGQVRNDATGRWGPQNRDQSVRVTGAFDLSETVKAVASYQYANIRLIGSPTQAVSPTGVIALPPFADIGINGVEARLNGNRTSFIPTSKFGEDDHRTKSHLARLSLDLELGDHTLSSVTAYAKYKLNNKDDFDFTSQQYFQVDRTEDYNQFSQELRLASPTGGVFDYLIGGYYFDSNWHSIETQFWRIPGFPPPGPPGSPPAPPPGELFNGPFTNDFEQDNSSVAAFASANLKLSDQFKLSGGLRYTHEKKDIVFGRTALPPITVWNTFANPPFPKTPVRFRDNFLNGNVSAQYNVSRDVMFYASYGVGSKAGGVAEAAGVPTGNPAAPDNVVKTERANTFELGTKISFDDRAGFFSLALFRTDVKDFQVTTFNGAGFVTSNIQARSQGFDAALDWRLSDQFSLRASLVHADAIDKATRFDLPSAPKWNGSVSADFRQPLSATIVALASANLTYRNRVFYQLNEGNSAKAYTPIGFSVGVADADGKWDLRLVARNINNSLSADFAAPSAVPQFLIFTGGSLASVSELRNISIRGSVRF
jgi:iron complex outermembrane recepter protein